MSAADLAWAEKLRQAGLVEDAAAACAAMLAAGPDTGAGAILAAVIRETPAEGRAALRATVSAAAAEAGADALHRLAAALHGGGDPDTALDLLTRTLDVTPLHFDALRLRALIRFSRRDYAAAAEDARAVLAVAPADLESQLILTRVLLRQGKAADALDLAASAADRALAAGPVVRDAALRQLADVQRQAGDRKAEIETCRRLVTLAPDSAPALAALGRALWYGARPQEGLALLDRALAADPQRIETRWLLCMLTLLPLFPDQARIAACRRDYAARLAELARDLATAPPERLAAVEPMIGDTNPFFLAYHMQDDRALQAVYGRMVSHAMQRLYPLPPPDPFARRAAGGRIHVGFVSGYFWRHSNWKLRRSWLRRFDRERFHVTGYHVGPERDAFTEELAGYCDAFHHLPGDFAAMLAALRDGAEDALIYPEIGMHRDTLKLAALRLAPVQAMSYGHPSTTGLPTMDYFLTSDLMEPPEGEAYYTERLVRLPGLSFAYLPLPPPATATRAEFDLPEGRILYLCAQTPQKYLPEADDLWPAIAARLPDAVFVFVEGAPLYDTGILRDRLKAAFGRAGLDYATHVRFVPHMPFERYQRLNRVCDIFLDAIGWSGMNTAIEAVQYGMPVVTLPGAFMRARHALGILRMLDIPETVARDRDDYVAIAARLGADPAWRAELRARTLAAKHRIEDDAESVDGLMRFVEAAVGRARLAAAAGGAQIRTGS
ncbi:MAG: hypothetical protein AB7G39_17045 [Alphaproteobacteria bacterium]